MSVPKRLAVTLLLISLTLFALGALSRKYVSLYFSRQSSHSRLPAGQITHDSIKTLDPDVLLAEAKRLAWLFNWPKAEPLYARLAYVAGSAVSTEGALVWQDRKGAIEALQAPIRDYVEPRLFPDGQRVAVTIGAGLDMDVWVYDIPHGTIL
jgi:hypothetical protein